MILTAHHISIAPGILIQFSALSSSLYLYFAEYIFPFFFCISHICSFRSKPFASTLLSAFSLFRDLPFTLLSFGSTCLPTRRFRHSISLCTLFVPAIFSSIFLLQVLHLLSGHSSQILLLPYNSVS